MRDERGGIFSRFVMFLLLLGLSGWEAGAVLISRVQAGSSAERAAADAAAAFSDSSSTTKARDAADDVVGEDGGQILSFRIDQPGHKVYVTIRRRARTIVIHRIGALKKHSTADVSATADIR